MIVVVWMGYQSSFFDFPVMHGEVSRMDIKETWKIWWGRWKSTDGPRHELGKKVMIAWWLENDTTNMINFNFLLIWFLKQFLCAHKIKKFIS